MGRGVGPEELAQRSIDIALMQSATAFDLSAKSERRRSARHLAKFFLRGAKALDVDLFIEIGAKEATASQRARSYLPEARVVAFEANPFTFERFKASFPESSRIEYHNLAIRDASGPVTFNVRQHDAGDVRADGHGSLLERDDRYPHDFTEVTVASTSLDRFFEDVSFKRCAMWIDVEGAAEAVLSGGGSVVSRAAIIMIEVEDWPLWKGSWTMPQVLAWLRGAGFVPVSRDFEYRYQYNLVFVHESFLDDAGLRWRLTQHFSECAVAAPWLQSDVEAREAAQDGKERGRAFTSFVGGLLSKIRVHLTREA